jgi:hypothetical protein
VKQFTALFLLRQEPNRFRKSRAKATPIHSQAQQLRLPIAAAGNCARKTASATAIIAEYFAILYPVFKLRILTRKDFAEALSWSIIFRLVATATGITRGFKESWQ